MIGAGYRPTQGSSWGYLEVNSSETLSFFGDKRPQNDTKNDLMAPRTTLECPHEGPFADSRRGADLSQGGSSERGRVGLEVHGGKVVPVQVLWTYYGALSSHCGVTMEHYQVTLELRLCSRPMPRALWWSLGG